MDIDLKYPCYIYIYIYIYIIIWLRHMIYSRVSHMKSAHATSLRRLVFSLHGPSSAISKFFTGVNSPSGEDSQCITEPMSKHQRGVETRP